MDDDPVAFLLVDDDEDDYFLTSDLLADIPDSRFQLDWIADPEAALRGDPPPESTCYLIDYRLGRTDGLSLLREADQQGCTAPDDPADRPGRAGWTSGRMQAGAADFLEKGRLDAALLERSIRYTLQGKRHADELERRVRERTAELASATRHSRPRSPTGSAPRKRRADDRRKDEFF